MDKQLQKCIEIMRNLEYSTMYSSAFHTALFSRQTEGRLIHGTDFTSDFTVRRWPPMYCSASSCMDTWALLRTGSLFGI